MQPIVAQVAPNEEQRPAVMDRGRDVVVTAGAGTGKTRTLVARYLSLVADGIPLRRIVAITFTRKAAREMRNRIRSELKTYLANPHLTGEERHEWDDVYNQLDAARIGTIHNLCTEILRAHPAELGLDPRFDVLDEGQGRLLVQDSIDEALAWAADDAPAVALFAFLGEWRLRSLLDDLMGQRLETAEALSDLPEPLWPKWQARIIEPIEAFLDDPVLGAAFADLEALKADGTLTKATERNDRLAEPMAALLDQWGQIQVARSQGDWPAVAACLGPLRANMKQVGRKDNWAPAEPKVIIRFLQGMYDERLAYFVGRKGVNLLLDRQMAELMPVLARLFERANSAYERRKEERGVLDFDDLEALALALLNDHRQVRRRWQNEVAAILVDEFQDTNGRQRDLVNSINGDGDKLFVVGDAKQSIYRFRGADVTVFRAERARVDAGGGKSYELSQSYRAHEALVRGANDLLAPVLGDTEDADRPWREPFAPLEYFREEPLVGIGPPYIEMQLTIGSKEGGALNRAADALVGRLAEVVEREGSAVGYGDVAILCRASTSFGAYEDALDKAGLPYLTVAGRGFYDRPEIRDLLNALKALADPTDDLALAGLLRSPVIGFSDGQLYDLVRQRQEMERSEPLWHLLQEDETAGQVVRLIADLGRQAGRISAASLLKAFLDATDYRAALLVAGYPRAARNVAKLLADTQSSGIVYVTQYLEYVAGLRAVAVREGEARATAEGAIRLMSIHAAKGLEFPVVVIGDINYSRPGRLDLLMEPGVGVLPRITDDGGAGLAMFQLLRADADDQEAAESDRLFYVAATRAKDKLILNGCMNLTAAGKPGRLRGWLKEVAGSTGLAQQTVDHDEDGDRAVTIDLRVGETAVGCTVYEPGYRVEITAPHPAASEQASETWDARMLEAIPADARWLDEAAESRESDRPQRVWRVVEGAARLYPPARLVGSLVHEALAVWRFPGGTFDGWMEARAQDYGLIDGTMRRAAVAEVKTLLRRFRRDALFEEMDGAKPRRHEVPYDRLDKAGRPEHGVIDALYQLDGIWVVVDFKSHRIRNETGLNWLLREQGVAGQLRRYATAVEELLGQRPVVKLCLLDYRGQVRVRDDLLESSA